MIIINIPIQGRIIKSVEDQNGNRDYDNDPTDAVGPVSIKNLSQSYGVAVPDNIKITIRLIDAHHFQEGYGEYEVVVEGAVATNWLNSLIATMDSDTPDDTRAKMETFVAPYGGLPSLNKPSKVEQIVREEGI